MVTARLIGLLLGSMFINLNMTTCHAPGEGESAGPPRAQSREVQLPGIDLSELSPRESAQWKAHVSELLAPCEAVAVSVADCVTEKRDCRACDPAASWLLGQVKQGKTKAQTEVAYKERFDPKTALSIDLSGVPIEGDPEAPITIVEWADFECPACAAMSPRLSEVVKNNPDVRLAFLHYPLPMHQNAEKAARAATAAGLQGKFWEMHHALFAAEVVTPARIDELAEKLGLDTKKFAADLRSEAVADVVAAQRKRGEKARLRATPTIFVNGRQFSFSTDPGVELEEWIALERDILGLEKPAAPAGRAAAEPAATSPVPAGAAQ